MSEPPIWLVPPLSADQRNEHLKAEALRNLQIVTTNLLRISAGAGAPVRLPGQLADVLIEWKECQKNGVYLEDHEIREALRGARQTESRKIENELAEAELSLAAAKELMVNGCLKFAAETLSENSTQQARGKSTMQQAFQDWQSALKTLRKIYR